MELDLGLDYTGGINKPTVDDIGYFARVDATGLNLEYVPQATMLCPMLTVGGVAATPGWRICGKIYLPRPCSALKLEAIIENSTAALTSRVRLVDDLTLIAVSGSTLSVALTTVSTRVISSALALVGDKVYQLQMECTGGAVDTDFAVIYSGRLT